MAEKVYTVNEILAEGVFQKTLVDYNLEEYFAVSTARTRKGDTMIILKKVSTGETVRATKNPERMSAFLAGLGEGFSFGKEWSY